MICTLNNVSALQLNGNKNQHWTGSLEQNAVPYSLGRQSSKSGALHSALLALHLSCASSSSESLA
jgi:hypothetical protein